MVRLIAFLPALMTVLLLSCGSGGRSADEYQRRIATVERQLLEVDGVLERYAATLPGGAGVIVDLRMELMNDVLAGLCSSRANDLIVTFPPTRNLLREKKSILGISYTNVLDLDSGRVTMNLSRFEIVRIDHAVLKGVMEIEGRGRLALSGRYTGLPFSGETDVLVQLRDTVRFSVEESTADLLVLDALPGSLHLRTRFSRRFLAWDIGYDHETPLQLRELFPQLRVPLTLTSLLDLPLSGNDGGFGIELTLDHTGITADRNRISIRSDVRTRRNRSK